MVIENLCPVCGYEMEDPPRDHNICPSCGTEFGLHDRNSSILELRAAWIATGPKWWSETDLQPENWNPFMQMVRLTSGFLTAVGPVLIQSASSTQTEVRGWTGWETAWLQPLGKQYEVEAA